MMDTHEDKMTKKTNTGDAQDQLVSVGKIRKSLRDRLQTVANKEDRPVSRVLNRAIEEYVVRHENGTFTSGSNQTETVV